MDEKPSEKGHNDQKKIYNENIKFMFFSLDLYIYIYIYMKFIL